MLKNKILRDKSFELLEILQKTLKDKIYHCYDKQGEIDVFLEDYAYFALVLVSFYEVTGHIKYLNKSEEILKETWDLFYDEETKTLQKNSQITNDLFVKDIVVQGKVTSAGNFTIIPVDCVMFLQQSSKDYRLDKAIQDKYKFTSCCLQTPEEYEVFKKGL